MREGHWPKFIREDEDITPELFVRLWAMPDLTAACQEYVRKALWIAESRVEQLQGMGLTVVRGDQFPTHPMVVEVSQDLRDKFGFNAYYSYYELPEEEGDTEMHYSVSGYDNLDDAIAATPFVAPVSVPDQDETDPTPVEYRGPGHDPHKRGGPFPPDDHKRY